MILNELRSRVMDWFRFLGGTDQEEREFYERMRERKAAFRDMAAQQAEKEARKLRMVAEGELPREAAIEEARKKEEEADKLRNGDMSLWNALGIDKEEFDGLGEDLDFEIDNLDER